MVLPAGWLILNLIVGALAGPPAVAAVQPPGISCTYRACMAKCDKLSGLTCNSYCEARVVQRVAARICPPAQAADDLDAAAAPAD
jgi:hypothetical protein